ncbi:hypothetical protein K7432_011896 [Basidiobolus ranarum]|uniref:Uncharacterized protein n=1 Tax=Basidiobolus ranarum TaxID=34480 RepID=A0ABR2VT48_9FUNG
MKFQYLAFSLLALPFLAQAVEPKGADSDAGGLGMTIFKSLVKAGLRQVNGRSACQACKGLCNRLFSGPTKDTCKYDICVEVIGGVSTTEKNPSCTLINVDH